MTTSLSCPDCGRSWDPGATFCGACGAALAPPSSERSRRRPDTARGPRRGLLLGGILATLALALVVASVDLPTAGSDDPDDDVALPSDIEDRRPAALPTDPPVRCTLARRPKNCLLWEVETNGPRPLGPRLPGAGVLVSPGPNGLEVREVDTGRVRWARDDLPPVRVLGVVDGTLVARTRTLTQGFDVRDGSDRWTTAGLHPVGLALQLTPPSVVLGAGGGGDTTGLVAVDPGDGQVMWEWSPPWDGPITSVQSTTPDAVLATGAGRLARIDAATGATAWTVDTVRAAHLQAHPPGHVSAQAVGGNGASPPLWLHDATTGEVVQRQDADVMGLLVFDDVVVVHRPTEAVVEGLSLDGGQRVWRHPLQADRGALAFPVDRASRAALVVTDAQKQHVARLDPGTGEPIWEVDLPFSPRGSDSSAFLGQAMLVGGRVVVEDPASVVTVLDLTTGARLVRVDAGVQLDVRSLDPLTLVRGNRWMRVDVRGDVEDAQ